MPSSRAALDRFSTCPMHFSRLAQRLQEILDDSVRYQQDPVHEVLMLWKTLSAGDLSSEFFLHCRPGWIAQILNLDEVVLKTLMS